MRIASQVSCVHTRAQIWQPMHSLYRICTGGMGMSYLSSGTTSIQSTGQNGTHTWQPVQLSSSTTAMSFGLRFLVCMALGSSGIDL